MPLPWCLQSSSHVVVTPLFARWSPHRHLTVHLLLLSSTAATKISSLTLLLSLTPLQCTICHLAGRATSPGYAGVKTVARMAESFPTSNGGGTKPKHNVAQQAPPLGKFESPAVSATAAAAATSTSPPASSSIALPPSPAQLGQSEPDPQVEQWKRQHLGDFLSAEANPDDALLACPSDNGEADQEAKDSDASISNTLPPFPDLPDATSSINNQDIASINATDAATDAASISTEDTSSVSLQASCLSLVHALLLDSNAGQPNNTSDSV